LTRIEEVLRKTTGQAWNLRVESVHNDADAPAVQAGDSATMHSRYRRQRTEVLQEPLVKRAFDALGAQIVRVDDGFGVAPTGPTQRTEIDIADGEEA
jgi:hypothetical protein